ncbi:AGE family epimerase/isomerase [Biformimicrobium ophioploci]|uniref:AGE family epimerase/isomerase n=1 Tax=Biformimicrobium ophioploci TaxID=3036711 RepID=A0ABQ6LWI3_9GAMM|nr:AGE family epimerase/isomerase [Microbulbifer sp. NKW57]GMG86474.1 AGE family epimerase/isomerase [Microbulbifer sp. NKW57]
MTLPDFRSPEFLRDHCDRILAFYQPNVVDTVNGGFHQNFLDDGSVFAPGSKHLVSSTRMIFNYCNAYRQSGEGRYLELARHGLDFLRTAHWDATRQGYHWTLRGQAPDDQTNHCYGLAFVVLALSACIECGIESARDDLYRAWTMLNEKFWQPQCGLYADEATPDWQQLSSYRGQNANMHSCEALLAAYRATGDEAFLQRAYTLAHTVAVTLADKADGLVWEHYTESLDIDWDYNRDDPKNLYRPWGFQPGHQTEWAKLLLLLHRERPEGWMIERARQLFERALETCWDSARGGILYGHAPDGSICDDDKYFWVQAESFAAAALLADATGEEIYWQWYDRIWAYSWEHFVDHAHGAWYRVLDRNNRKYSQEKSTAGGKCDYHTLGACWEVLALVSDQ